MPEIVLKEAWEKVHVTLIEPDVCGSFTIVSFERIYSVLLGPDVNHLSNSMGHGVSENCCKVRSHCCTEQ